MAINLTAPVPPNPNAFVGGAGSADYQRAMEAYNSALAAYNQAIGTGYTADVGATTATGANAASMAQLQAQIAGTSSLADKGNAAALAQLQAQIAGQQGVATAQQAAELARLQATITSTEKVAGQQQALTAAESTKAQSAAMAQLQATIAAQRGIATEEQAAQLARLQASIASTEKLATQGQTFQAGESAAERAARLAELTQSQTGDINLATKQAQLTQETEQARFLRAQQAQTALNTTIADYMQRFGIGGPAGTPPPSGTPAPAPTGQSPEERAAEVAAFAQAKDRIGLVNRAAQNDIDAAAVQRGILDSGLHAKLSAQGIESGRGQLGQVIRDQTTQGLQRKYQVADRDVAAAQAKRGQDIGLTTSMMALLKQTGTGNY